MITQYKNSEQILKSSTGNIGTWMTPEDSELLKLNTIPVSGSISNVDQVELHVYDLNGGYIAGNHKADSWSSTIDNAGINLNVHKNIRDLGLNRGEFKFAYNFLSNKIGEYASPISLFVKEIKSNKQEIILGTNVINKENSDLFDPFIEQLDDFFNARHGVQTLKDAINNSIAPLPGFHDKYFEIKKIITENATVQGVPYDEELNDAVQYTITKGSGEFRTQETLTLLQIQSDAELFKYWVIKGTGSKPQKLESAFTNLTSLASYDNQVDKFLNDPTYKYFDEYNYINTYYYSNDVQTKLFTMLELQDNGTLDYWAGNTTDGNIPYYALSDIIKKGITNLQEQIINLDAQLIATGNSTNLPPIDVPIEIKIKELQDNVTFLSNKLNEFESNLFISFSHYELNSFIQSARNQIKQKVEAETETISSEELEALISSTQSQYRQNFCLNFGSNKIYQIINMIRLSDTDIGIKLYEPSNDITEKQICWITEMVKKPYVDTIILIPIIDSLIPNTLQGPNFSINVDDNYSSDTAFQTWDDLLGSDVNTSQQILDGVFSGSAYGEMKLNIDYSDFSNFIHFSSATERVKNFKYKLELIEYYVDRLTTLVSASYSGSVSNNIIDTVSKRNAVISGFDDFEKYLYFQSGSNNYFTNAVIAVDDGTVEVETIAPWPKLAGIPLSSSLTWNDFAVQLVETSADWISNTTSSFTTTRPWLVYRTTSTEAITYYQNLLDQADLFDRRNDYALVKTIPEHIRLDSENAQYELFVNMMGHHFDVMWTYIKYLTQIHLREEHPEVGMSKDLIYEVAKSFGWKLHNGNFSSELWNYLLGTDESGSFNDDGNLAAKTKESLTHEVWRRQLNNLPYLLKTKGTARSVRALVACYGIPSTFLTIREYGGPSQHDIHPLFIKNQFDYGINIAANRYLKTQWNQVEYTGSDYRFPDTIELRFKTHLDSTSDFSYGTYGKHTLFQVDSGSATKMMLVLEPSGSAQKGNLHFYISGSGGYLTASISNQYIFDDGFSSVMVKRQTSVPVGNTATNSGFDLYLKKAKYGKLTINASASISLNAATKVSHNPIWMTSGSMYVGYGNNPNNSKNFTGSLQELRYWTVPLNEDSFDTHVLSPGSYNSNNATGSYYDLKVRFPLLDTFDAQTTTVVSSSHPNQNYNTYYDNTLIALNLIGTWPSESDAFDSFEEEHYIESPSLGGNNLYSEKVRIEANSISEPLNSQRKVESSLFDTAPLDSKRLGVYFSPQSIINDDISRHMGYIDLDDYIGDPGDKYKTSYSALRSVAQEYWKKYQGKNDMAAYIRLFSLYDFSMFKTLEQLLPARANKILGLVIEPNILERSKVSFHKEPTAEDIIKNAVLDGNTLPTLISDYPVHESTIEPDTTEIIGDYANYESTITETTLELSGDENTYESTIASIFTNTSSSATESMVQNSVVSLKKIKNGYYIHKDTGWLVPTSASQYPRTATDNTWGITPGSLFPVTSSILVPSASYLLVYSGFNANISNTIIGTDAAYNWVLRGVESKIKKHQTGNATGSDYRITIGASTTSEVGSANRAVSNILWSGSSNEYYYGGSSDTWSQSFTSAQVNSSDFNIKISASGSAPGTTLTASIDDVKLKIYYSYYVSSSAAEIQDYLPASTKKMRYSGAQMTSPAINEPSNDTPDKGPVITVTDVNPNTLLIQKPHGNTGTLRLDNSSVQINRPKIKL